MLISQAPIKNFKRLRHFWLSFLISDWNGMIIVALNPKALSNTNAKMFLWLFCGEDNRFVYCIFNLTIYIQWKIVFLSIIAWFYLSFPCFGDSFIVSLNHLPYIFYKTIAHFNCLPIKYSKQVLNFGESLSKAGEYICHLCDDNFIKSYIFLPPFMFSPAVYLGLYIRVDLKPLFLRTP